MQTMPLRSGFRSRVDCPLWLLDFQDITIIPLANPGAKRKQANPIYSRRPGQGGEMLAENCSIEVIAKRFSIGHRGNKLFVAAEIDMPEFALQGWINIWQGPHTPPAWMVAHGWIGPPQGMLEELMDPTDGVPLTGTLFCALDGWMAAETLCLCGSCMHSWGIQGWICEDLWRHRFGMGIEF